MHPIVSAQMACARMQALRAEAACNRGRQRTSPVFQVRPVPRGPFASLACLGGLIWTRQPSTRS
jgi:hypothetical protein